jgi:uncharacterized protein YyaL (SSP411 family)
MAGNAAMLFMLTGDGSYREHAEKIVGHLATRAGEDSIGAASLQSAFDTLLRGRLAFVIGEGFPAESLVAAALAEADPALITARVNPETIPTGHPAEGKRPTGKSALFLCDASRCLPEIPSADEARETFARTRSGLR